LLKAAQPEIWSLNKYIIICVIKVIEEFRMAAVDEHEAMVE
jgi:hypothetical protein